ncbi:nuclear transport factor 2 family protein [Rhizobium halophilum]|uniref:nuclear transport factor 2 family protein n=1 Tax=Rhizobium halophilum TaxID=2846852 RepID=UPI00293EDAFE|nr:nuclear transport factor 2 family protein [Rhizobium halophilum]
MGFWNAVATDAAAYFELEETVTMEDRANIRWRFNFGDGNSVRGVNLMRVRDGKIVEALGYAKSPGQAAPLPEAAKT